MTNATSPQLVSADSHLLEPADIWTNWLPARFRVTAPQLVVDDIGGHAWWYPDTGSAVPIAHVSGLPTEVWSPRAERGPRYEDVRPGTYRGSSRAEDQDADGVSAEVIYPTERAVDYYLSHPDRDTSLAGLAAYNRFVLEEFCTQAKGRLYPIAQLPTTGVADCVTTLRWAAEMGFVGAVLASWPNGGDRVLPEDEPFWRTAEELDLPVCIHVGVRSRAAWLDRRRYTAESAPARRSLQSLWYSRPIVHSGFPTHRLPNPGVSLGRSAEALGELLLSGVFDRHKALRICLAESWVGWIPRLLEAVDDLWAEYCEVAPGADSQKPPSRHWRSHLRATFLKDDLGVRVRELLGPSTMMWSSDYPHFITTWPRSRDITSLLASANVSDQEQEQIMATNCIDFFGLSIPSS